MRQRLIEWASGATNVVAEAADGGISDRARAYLLEILNGVNIVEPEDVKLARELQRAGLVVWDFNAASIRVKPGAEQRAEALVADLVDMSEGDDPLKEGWDDDEEHVHSTSMDDLDPADLIEFGDAWASLSAAVREQVKDVLDDPESDVNVNAIEEAVNALKSWPAVVGPLEEFLDRDDDDWAEEHAEEIDDFEDSNIRSPRYRDPDREDFHTDG